MLYPTELRARCNPDSKAFIAVTIPFWMPFDLLPKGQALYSAERILGLDFGTDESLAVAFGCELHYLRVI